MENTNVDILETLGFKKVSSEIKALKTRKRKLALAYEFYRFVRPEKITAFNEKLKKKTLKGDGRGLTDSYQELTFSPVETYDKVPPNKVLNSMQEAVDRKCFDSFEIAHIVNVEDPILFGRIERCPDRFFIDQWDDDVKIDDILDQNEG